MGSYAFRAEPESLTWSEPITPPSGTFVESPMIVADDDWREPGDGGLDQLGADRLLCVRRDLPGGPAVGPHDRVG